MRPSIFLGIFISGLLFSFSGAGAWAENKVSPEATRAVTAEVKVAEKVVVRYVPLPPLLFNVPLKRIYALPDPRSKLIFEIPFDFKLVDMTPDERWVKIRAEYDFLGHHVVEGWGRVRQ